MEVFVTDGNQRSSLAITRALGSKGLRVVVGEDATSSLAGSSRYCFRSVQYPSPVTQAAEFCDFVANEMVTGSYGLLVPTTDISMQLVAKIRTRLPRHLRAALPDCDQVSAIQDKRNILLLARKISLCCPATFMIGPDEQIETVSDTLTYPAVIKPRVSRYSKNGAWSKGEVQYASTRMDLLRKYASSDREIPRPLVQEFVRGEGRGIFLLLWNGELKAAFAHRRVREKPPSGGVSVLCESVPLDRELVEKSVAMLRELHWNGVAMLEFKQDPNGVPKLMEINGRFWGSLQLAIDSGVNFPELLWRLAIGKDVKFTTEYRVGIRSRWLLGDIDNLLIRFKQSESAGESRTRILWEFIQGFERHTRNEVARLGDLRPAAFELKQYAKSMK